MIWLKDTRAEERVLSNYEATLEHRARWGTNRLTPSDETRATCACNGALLPNGRNRVPADTKMLIAPGRDRPNLLSVPTRHEGVSRAGAGLQIRAALRYLKDILGKRCS